MPPLYLHVAEHRRATTDSAVVNDALAQWEWDLSAPADKDFAEAARLKEGVLSED